ncbi:MAG TPA: lipid-A-disaccharide synthase N-terminal domain-containing protein [Candidatus Eisenbacteria bacterium]|nr:lipid-A-disaccharide synthase N-terminal domain-containing protein [Candidatus Eisenbacteria bacterium]
MIRWWWSPGLWSGIGLTGQVLFGSRFLVQWIASETAKRSVVPRTFWYLSLLGGVTLFAYACYRRDPVFVIGQGAGLLVYARNLMRPRSSASPA